MNYVFCGTWYRRPHPWYGRPRPLHIVGVLEARTTRNFERFCYWKPVSD
ncbi:hypothetical protein [Scytonema sp. NUACC26]